MGLSRLVRRRPLLGSNWDNGAHCGSRCSNWNNSALNLNANYGSQGASDTAGLYMVSEPKPARLGVQAVPKGKIHNRVIL